MERIKLFLEKKKYWNLNQIIKEPKEINYAASEKERNPGGEVLLRRLEDSSCG